MKITDVIISGLLKRGVLHEARNLDVEFEVPVTRTGDIGEPREDKMLIKVKVDHMTIRIDKEEK